MLELYIVFKTESSISPTIIIFQLLKTFLSFRQYYIWTENHQEKKKRKKKGVFYGIKAYYDLHTTQGFFLLAH